MYEEFSHGHYPSTKCLEIHFCIQQPNETCNSLTWLIMVQYISEMWLASFPLLRESICMDYPRTAEPWPRLKLQLQFETL